MAWLIAMRILSYHARAEDRKFVICCRMIGEHTVQFFGKSVFTSYKVDQSVNVMLNRPKVLPSVAFANVWCIVIGLEVLDKDAFVVTWLHERSSGVINILVVLRTFVKFVRNVLFAHLLRHFGNAIVIESVFQCFG